MDAIRHLIVGAGVTGLAAAAFSREKDYLVLEADREIGGYCKTVKKDGFVWDYSGHFFHFKHPDVESWLRHRMIGQEVRTIQRRSFISYGGKLIDFPFQKNIHQLPQDEFIDCLHDLYFARLPGAAAPAAASFQEMLYGRFGRSIAEKFLIPYNEKLYACDLATLDEDAMGRFFRTPIHRHRAQHARPTTPATAPPFRIRAAAPSSTSKRWRARCAGGIALGEADRHRSRAPGGALPSPKSSSSAWFRRSLPAGTRHLAHDDRAFTWNKVLVFNLGFDKKGPKRPHWIYYPSRARSFYRVGFYDNIFDTDRMSLYVELGYARDAVVDVDAALSRVLDDLRAEGVITDHELIAHPSVLMDPAYVHITRASLDEHQRLKQILNGHGVYPAGRYGGWTYCSIEDNIVEARALVAAFESRAT
jgi:protoporphyrinogen oxidase